MKKVLCFVFAFSIIFLIVAKLLSYRIVFQITPSLPKGIYWIEKNVDIEKGSLLLFEPPPKAIQLINDRGWWTLDLKYLLMKPVVAKKGDHVRVLSSGLYINGDFFGPVQKFDSQGLPLPEFQIDHVLSDREYFTASQYKNSFDSRYFGIIKENSIVGIAKKII